MNEGVGDVPGQGADHDILRDGHNWKYVMMTVRVGKIGQRH